jgi:hypothetical protein
MGEVVNFAKKPVQCLGQDEKTARSDSARDGANWSGSRAG